MDTVPAYGSPDHAPSSSERHADGSMHSGKSNQVVNSKPEMAPFVTQCKKPANKVSVETTEQTDTPADDHIATPCVSAQDASEASKEEASAPEPSVCDSKLAQLREDNIAHLSDAGSDDGATARGPLGASSAMIRGGESLSSTVTPGVSYLQLLLATLESSEKTTNTAHL
jgi:hypothetical protein